MQKMRGMHGSRGAGIPATWANALEQASERPKTRAYLSILAIARPHAEEIASFARLGAGSEGFPDALWEKLSQWAASCRPGPRMTKMVEFSSYIAELFCAKLAGFCFGNATKSSRR